MDYIIPSSLDDIYGPGAEHADDGAFVELSASEALYGFAAWLTTRSKPVTAGANHDASIWAELVAEFCDANDLPKPREEWTNWLVHPS